MDEIPYSVFIDIGKELCSNKPFNVALVKKTKEEYIKDYINNLEIQRVSLEKELDQLMVEINTLQNKNIQLIKQFAGKRRGNVVSLLYTNNNVVNYFTSINTLESKQYKLNNITIAKLEEQYSNILALHKNVNVLIKRVS